MLLTFKRQIMAGKCKNKNCQTEVTGSRHVNALSCEGGDHVFIERKESLEDDPPRIMFTRGDAGSQTTFTEVLAEFCLDGVSK